jgi:sulfatase maturation enzyme AslB (radical SAM superfamily)
MTITANGRAVMHLGLARYWNYYTFEVPASRDDDVALTFRLNKALPSSYHPDDSRIDLGARVGAFEFHDDELRRQRTEALHENAVLNRAELEAGSTVLASFPLNLGIDLYGKCNIKPPCVYCWWDQCKSLEGEDVNAIVDDRTLLEYGPFFDAAQSLINCSFGEPLLHPRLAEIARLLGTRDKVAEIATNGQAFTPATVGALAGQPILLYISLDAASPEVYGRLRNDRWHEVVAGLTFLREARRRANGLPKVRMVFMPMRANLGDLEAYFRLCRMVEAEALVLRPLNYAENTSIRAERGGYQFDYERELLNREEIEAVCRRAEEYAERYGLWLISQFDFGAPKRPRVRGAHREGSSHGDSAA